MKKNIKLIIACSLLSSVAFAQTAENKIEEKKNKTQIGRGIYVPTKESTASTVTVSAEDLSHKTSIDPSNNLFGLLNGLQVLQNGGTAAWDDGATLMIRGVGSFNAKSPLILIDGFERSINNLTVQEIESVTVLKDAPSLALYGMKGSNGVILIKTKRGSLSETPQIDFSYQFNVASPNRLPKFVDGYTYAQALNEGLSNDGLSPRYSEQELNAFRDQTHPDFYPNVNWVDETLRSNSFGDNVNFSIRGGGKVVKYFSQVNYLDNRGLFKPTSENDGYSTQMKFSKLNVRTNLDIDMGKYTKVQLNMLGNFSEKNAPATGLDDIFNAIYQVPSGAFPVRTQDNLFGGTSVYNNNPVALISGSGTERTQTRTLYADMTLTQGLDFLTPGLSGSLRVAFDDCAAYRDLNSRDFAYQSTIWDWNTNEGTYKKLRNETELKFASGTKAFVRHFNFHAQLNYDAQWKKHKLNATTLYTMDKVTYAGRNQTFANLDITGHAHYAYNDRYLVDVSLAGAASSILDPDDRWGFLPSVGLGWVVSEEDFAKVDWLNLLKIRASWGITAEADYPANLFRNLYGSGNGFFFKDALASNSGLREKQLRVDGLTYEKSNKSNVGIDFMAWNKLSATIDLFYERRKDILVDGGGRVSSVLGINAPKVNKGIVDNKGVELGLKWADQINDFSYQLGGQFSFTRNKIKNMEESYRPEKYQERTGLRVGQVFGYQVEGIYQNQAEIDNRDVKQKLSEVRPGDLMFKDQNGDKIIDQYDMVAIGYNQLCPEIYFAFDLGAEYKGVGLFAQFQGVGNYSRMLDTRSLYRPLINNNTVSEHYYNNRWTAENPTAQYPRLTAEGSANNYNSNSLWLADASFLKLRTLELYYQFPNRLLAPAKVIKGARLFARAHDLFTLDKIDVADPESIGVSHPTMTQYTFGFNLRF